MPNDGGDQDAFGPLAQLVIAAVLVAVIIYLLAPLVRTGFP